MDYGPQSHTSGLPGILKDFHDLQHVICALSSLQQHFESTGVQHAIGFAFNLLDVGMCLLFVIAN